MGWFLREEYVKGYSLLAMGRDYAVEGKLIRSDCCYKVCKHKLAKYLLKCEK